MINFFFFLGTYTLGQGDNCKTKLTTFWHQYYRSLCLWFTSCLKLMNFLDCISRSKTSQTQRKYQSALLLLTLSASAEDGATKFDKVFDIIITLESLNGTYIRNKLFSRSFSKAKLYKYPLDSRPVDPPSPFLLRPFFQGIQLLQLYLIPAYALFCHGFSIRDS